MRYIKFIILFATISFFTSSHFQVQATEDCSQYKKLHKKLLCKSRGGTTRESAKTVESEKSEKKGWKWLRKIREYGGKNIGEPG